MRTGPAPLTLVSSGRWTSIAAAAGSCAAVVTIAGGGKVKVRRFVSAKLAIKTMLGQRFFSHNALALNAVGMGECRNCREVVNHSDASCPECGLVNSHPSHPESVPDPMNLEDRLRDAQLAGAVGLGVLADAALIFNTYPDSSIVELVVMAIVGFIMYAAVAAVCFTPLIWLGSIFDHLRARSRNAALAALEKKVDARRNLENALTGELRHVESQKKEIASHLEAAEPEWEARVKVDPGILLDPLVHREHRIRESLCRLEVERWQAALAPISESCNIGFDSVDELTAKQWLASIPQYRRMGRVLAKEWIGLGVTPDGEVARAIVPFLQKADTIAASLHRHRTALLAAGVTYLENGDVHRVAGNFVDRHHSGAISAELAEHGPIGYEGDRLSDELYRLLAEKEVIKEFPD